jgi:hypothetical protein
VEQYGSSTKAVTWVKHLVSPSPQVRKARKLEGFVEMVLVASPQSSALATNPPPREAQAQANERLIREGLGKKSKSPPKINCEEVADKVYRLMQCDLVLERERATRLGG